MYHDYFDDADTTSLRNPYGPEVPLPEPRAHRPRLLLAGMVGAGLSVVAPAAGGAVPERVVAAHHPARPAETGHTVAPDDRAGG